MIGKILGLDKNGIEGVIKAEDGNRYKFLIDDIKNSSEIKVNDSVDFIIEDNYAKEIYLTKTSSVDMSAVNDKISEFSSKVKDFDIPKVDIKKNIKVSKKSLKNNIIYILAGFLILILIFSSYKNAKIEEKFVEYISNNSHFDITYKDYGCSGLFYTNCYLENTRISSDNSSFFETKEINISNISGITDIFTSNKLMEIPFSVEFEGIKISENLKEDFFNTYVSSKKRHWDGRVRKLSVNKQKEEELKRKVFNQIFVNLNNKNIYLNAKLKVANKKINSLEIKELSYDNDIIPILIDTNLSGLDSDPIINSFSLKLNGKNIYSFTYHLIKDIVNDPSIDTSKLDKYKCLNEEEFTHLVRKAIVANIKEDIRIKEPYRQTLLDFFAHNTEGIQLKIENKNNHSLDSFIIGSILNGNISRIERDLKIDISSYGDKGKDILQEFNDVNLKNFKLEVIERISKNNKEELNELDSLIKELDSFNSKEESLEKEFFNNYIKENVSIYRDQIFPKLKEAYLSNEFLSNYKKNRYQKVVLNNKQYTLSSSFNQLKKIKLKAPDKYDAALEKVVSKFEPFGYNSDFLRKHIDNNIEKYSFTKFPRNLSIFVKFYNNINTDLNYEEQLKEILNLDLYNIPYSLQDIKKLVENYNKVKYDNPKKVALNNKKRELSNRKYQLENQLSNIKREIKNVNYCNARSCVELINFKYLEVCK